MHKLDIKIKCSRQFLTLLSLTLFGSVIIIFTLPLLVLQKIGLLVIAFFYGGFLIWQHGLLLSKYSIVALSLNSDGWQIQKNSSSKKISAELCGSSTITSLVCVLRFNLLNQKRKCSFILFRDSLLPGLYRKLLFNIRTIKIL